MARKKKAGVVFIYPGHTAPAIDKTISWTLFHRNVGTSTQHEDSNEYCWCSPVCIPTHLLEEGYSEVEYNHIVHCSMH